MQSTGHASTQAVSLTPMQGSAMMYAMLRRNPLCLQRHPEADRECFAQALALRVTAVEAVDDTLPLLDDTLPLLAESVIVVAHGCRGTVDENLLAREESSDSLCDQAGREDRLIPCLSGVNGEVIVHLGCGDGDDFQLWFSHEFLSTALTSFDW